MLSGLGAKLWAALIAIGGILVLIVTAGAKLMSVARKAERGKTAEKVNEQVVKGKRARRTATRKRMSKFDRD